MKKNTQELRCYGQVIGRGFANEWYETASRDAGKRARELRGLGLKVSVEAMGFQVTPVGRVKMTLVSVHGTYDEIASVPSVQVVR